jgi:hypothetical protein
MKTVIISLAMLMTVLVAKSEASGQWTINASSCVADPGSIQNNLYFSTGGTDAFTSTKTGTISLYCPIAVDLGFTPAYIFMSYHDDADIPTTGCTGNSFATLTKMNNTTGTLTNVNTPINSNSGPQTAGIHAVSTTFTDTYNPSAYSYYIRIDMVRNCTTINEIVYNVGVTI